MFHQHFKKVTGKSISITLLLSALFLFSVGSAHAASLIASPSSAKVSIGNIVTVKIFVSTQGKSINNSEATVLFPADLLEVVSISKSSSIFSMWVEDPKFSNITGRVSFNGGLPNPGYIGESGEIVSIAFRAKKSGTASVVFSDSAVRENNGLGTDILTSKQQASIQIDAALNEIPAVNTSSNSLPLKPQVVSSTHPQQDAWYTSTSATFSWTMPNDITSIQTLLGQSANSTPTVMYDSSVSQRTVNNLSDGVLYFHLRYMNSMGWGPSAHYKIQIDSTPPEKFTASVETKNVYNIVTLNAQDKVSGIDSYLIKIDGSSDIRVKKDTLVNNQFTLPVQAQERHTLSVTAFDKAGNFTESQTTFSSPEIKAPLLKVIPESITKDQSVRVDGTTEYSNANAIVFVQKDAKDIVSYPATTKDDGSFSVVTDDFKVSGSASIWAQLVFSDSVRSPISEKVHLKINDTEIVKAAKMVTYVLSAIIPMVILILGLIFLSYLGWHKFFGLKKKIGKELDSTVADIHKALLLFKDELSKQLDILEKAKQDKGLNRKEEKIFKELQNNIDNIDALIEKKIKKIK